MRRRPIGYCRERQPGLSFELMSNEFQKLKQFQSLSTFSRARLYVHLCNAAGSMVLRDILSREVAAGQARRELESLISSLNIIAEFGTNGSSKAMRALEAVVTDWIKSENSQNEVPYFFFDQRRGIEDCLAVDSALKQFFTTAKILKRHIKKAKQHIHEWPVYADHMSPVRWLIGYELPRIYQRIFKRKLGLSVSGSGPTGNGPGIEFIKASLRFMGRGGQQSPATIRTHVYAAKTAYKAFKKQN